MTIVLAPGLEDEDCGRMLVWNMTVGVVNENLKRMDRVVIGQRWGKNFAVACVDERQGRNVGISQKIYLFRWRADGWLGQCA